VIRHLMYYYLQLELNYLFYCSTGKPVSTLHSSQNEDLCTDQCCGIRIHIILGNWVSIEVES
jgi:hypothetical protein